MSSSAQNPLRRQVLAAFKSLHRTRQLVFDGDAKALAASRTKINAEYRNAKPVDDASMIASLIARSQDVETVLRSSVIQAEEIGPGKYRAHLRSDITRLDNVPFQQDAADNYDGGNIGGCGGGRAAR